jgi:PKD repeat protein
MIKSTIKISFLFALTFFVQTALFSQSAIDYQNVREGESVEYCIEHKIHAELLKNEEYRQSYLQDQDLQRQIIETMQNDGNFARGVVYKIPIVFHVLHNGGNENISDEQIFDCLRIMNRDYRRENPDADNVHVDYQGSPADIEVEFVLATKAPNGVCFNGITRTESSLSFVTSNQQGGNQVDAIVAGNDVYNGEWPGNRYLNVFICGNIGGAAGYTYRPSNWIGSNMRNGIWVLHNYVGSIGTGNINRSRTMTHEAGHWLGLPHTWGGTNNPGLQSNCDDDDGVQDTPVCIGVTSCNLNSNSCDNDNDFWGFDKRDNVENYMEYSYCSKMFTQGQANLMRAVLNSNVAGRNNLWTNANLQFTGADGNETLCKVEFSSNQNLICSGESIQFQDNSYNNVSTWFWEFEGGVPATSNERNPIVVYNQPGKFKVKLTASDGTNTFSEEKESFVSVFYSTTQLPLHEGFETYNAMVDALRFSVEESDDIRFEIDSSAAYSGNKSVKLQNFNLSGNQTRELAFGPVDLSNVSEVTLSFRYAYRKRISTNLEALRVLVSNDCGETWVVRRTIQGNTLSSLVETQSWTPSSQEEWITVHVTNITSQYWNEDFRFKFRFESDGGNNLFIDDINIYSSSPSNEIIQDASAGIESMNSVFVNLEVYPNPTDNELNVKFNSETNALVIMSITDITGKLIQQSKMNTNTGSNLVTLPTNQLSKGLYFLKIDAENSEQVVQFVVK